MTIKSGAPTTCRLLVQSSGVGTHLPKPTVVAVPQRFNQYLGNLVVANYTSVAGRLVAETGVGVSSVSTAYANPAGINTGLKASPTNASTGADFRFLPNNVYVGGNIWFPLGGSTTTYPQLKRVQRTATVDPVVADTYFYQQHRPQVGVHAGAFTMNTKGYFQVLTAATGNNIRTTATFMMVAVPHHGPGGYYPLFDCQRQGPNGTDSQVHVFYIKGNVEVWIATKKLFSIPTVLNLAEPFIVGWTYNKTTSKLVFFVFSRASVIKTINCNHQYFWDFSGDIGARPTAPGGTTIDWTNVADMDILEIDMWNAELNNAQLTNTIGLLKQVYGIGR